MAKVRKKSVVPVYIVASIWLIWASCMPMYKISHFVWLGIWSFLAYKLSSLLWRGKVVEVKEPEPEYIPTGNTELDELMLEGREALRQMKELDGHFETFKGAKIKPQVQRLEELTEDILEHIEKNPNKASQIRKFMNYYLPTTLKLLNTYSDLLQQSARGKNINATMTKIEGIMGTIVTAFEKQLDSLFQANALDISTDITVLEGMLEREGLASQTIRK